MGWRGNQLLDLQQVKGNTYVLKAGFLDLGLYMLGEKECILIDTGFHKTARDEVIPFFRDRNLELKGILCTHGHVDHAGGNSLLKNTYQCPVAVPYVEHVLCENAYNMYVLSDNLRFRFFADTLPRFSYDTDVVVNPEETNLSFLGIPFTVLKLFGHSAYQVGYVTPDNVAYLADALLSRPMIQKTKLPYLFDVGHDMESKERIRRLECDGYILSHEGVHWQVTNLVEENLNHLKSRMSILLELLHEPTNFDAYTARVIEAMGINNDLRKVAYMNRTIRSYLSYFMDQGLVVPEIRDNQIVFVKQESPEG